MKILLVEDDPHNLHLFKLELRDENWTVIAAENGKEALNILEKEIPDVAIIDFKLPDIDGAELFAKIKGKCPDLPIKIYSGHPYHEGLGVSEGDFMIKSSDSHELKEFIRHCLPCET